MVGDFKIPLSVIDRSSKQKTNKEMEDLSNIISQLDWIDIIEHSTQQ